MREKHLFFVLLSVVSLTVSGQSKSQVKLLKDAYKSQSTELLYKFFDNWSEEVKSNEDKAQNPYVAEAYKVFAAFYQPLQTFARSGKRYTMYDDKPYFIVQSTLWRVRKADFILSKQAEIDSFMIARVLEAYADDTAHQKKWLENLNPEDSWTNIKMNYNGDDYASPFRNITVPVSTVDSAVEFRPPVHIEGKKVVYLTKKYEKMLNSFLGKRHIAFSEENIMQPAKSKGESLSKHRFFNQAALIFYGHWGGYWQFETYPKANQIIFNPEMNRAVVMFRYVYEGGEAVLEKQNGEWVVVDSHFTWIE
ncbi:MAG: hypothetical protein K5882_11325 [Bacteroidales bacterium]|nr:hypothetical protein [Bacteroidales bacterium]